jgi:hypothetical protein
MKMIRTSISILGLALLLCTASFSISMTASAQTAAADPAEQKDAWQSRYRRLLQDSARLAYNAEISRENYARAQRRNYPRGGARQQFLVDAEAADKELVDVKKEIEKILLEARHEALPPNWRFQVEDEPIDRPSPASASDEDDSAADRAGRNPLYLDDDKN